MVTKIVRRVVDYTQEEYNAQLVKEGKCPGVYASFFHYWALKRHEEEYKQFLTELITQFYGKPITVSGFVWIGETRHKLKPRTLSIGTAFDEMLPTDIQDFSIIKTASGTYYVMTVHPEGHNTFRFRLDD